MEMQFTVKYRGKSLRLKRDGNSSLGDLGREIVDLTGVAPHTLRLLVPKRQPLQPMLEHQRTVLLSDCGIAEGMTVTMMGSSAAEVASVSRPSSSRDRTLGFGQEEQRDRQRSSYGSSRSEPLPSGNYIFCGFRPLSSLPGVELRPLPEEALKIMHRLAKDRGIVALMNKYKWRVGIMTEMPPIGYVGVSPKCTLGFNKNRGEEISLRVRTDDLKGFRKYEIIKKTLLHELAHMVHDEHDDKFLALDSQLNKEVISMDWTRSRGHTVSGAASREDGDSLPLADGGNGRGRRALGFRLGGNADYAHHMGARAAAVAAAVHRWGSARSSDLSAEPALTGNGSEQPGPPEAKTDESVSGNSDSRAAAEGNRVVGDGSLHGAAEHVSRNEPDPDDSQGEGPDPDEAMDIAGLVSTALTGNGSEQSGPPEAKTDESVSGNSDSRAAAEGNRFIGDGSLRGAAEHVSRDEPDPDDSQGEEPDPDEAMDIAGLVSSAAAQPARARSR